MAFCYGEMGEHNKELKILRKIYSLKRRMVADDHPDMIKILCDMAYACYALKRYAQSLELQNKAYILQCRTLGEKHTNAMISLDNLACAYEKLGNSKKAKELRAKLEALRSKEDTN